MAAVAGTPQAPGITRRAIGWLVGVLLAVAAAGYGYQWWVDAQRFATTDNAYVNAGTVDIAAEVAGRVVRVHVRQDQRVAAGAPLFDLDPVPFELAVERAQAQLELARQGVAQSGAGVAAAEAQLAQRVAELRNAESSLRRNEDLVARNFLSRQALDNAATAVATARAAVRAAEANVQQARSSLGSPGARNATIRAAEVTLRQAQLDLQRTRVTAPASGTIANLSLRPGQAVQERASLFVLISDNDFWIDANFKETELERIRVGQPVAIVLDAYPGHALDGVVESLSAGSGTAFSLLPPQHATGNWVKVTQRVPVRIRVTRPDPDHPLRIGTTATVRVTVR